MEHSCGLCDGSEQEMAKGYHLGQVTGANLEHNKITFLYSEAFSSTADGFISIPEKMKDIISTVKGYIGTVGTWAVDRAGDDQNLIKP